MRERPIPFTGAMVRAVLEGRKTQTRRPVKHFGLYAIEPSIHGATTSARERAAMAEHGPYGVPGDQLWVREAWRTFARFDKTAPRDLPPLKRTPLWYEADGPLEEPHAWGKYRPPMFMPRWGSRIQLEVTRVRVDRVQDISYEDAWAEGIQVLAPTGPDDAPADPIGAYRNLWRSLNADGTPQSWAANPWVWVIDFRVIRPQHTTEENRHA